MRLDAERLSERLRHGLAPIYLVAGEETLLVQEACEAIRARAVQEGCADRRVLTVESGFDWNELFAETQSMSLFAERRLIELRIPTGKPGEKGAEMLMRLAAEPPPDLVVLVVCGKLERAVRESAWVKAIDNAGVVVQVWPLDSARLPGWISARLRARGLEPEAGVAEHLAYHMEGNLLACAQEIDKLVLAHGAGAVRLADLEESLSDNARFTVFILVDTCLHGDAAAVARIFENLRAEGVEPILVLWALARELRAMANLAQAVQAGASESSVLAKVWAQRRAPVTAALRRLRLGHWQALLARAARADRVLKGRARGDIWAELQAIGLALCGVRPPPTEA